jgi:hypothetical protein
MKECNMLKPQKLTPEQSFNLAAEELEKVMAAYHSPQEELFTRYLSKNAEEKEALVLALIGRAIFNKKRG